MLRLTVSGAERRRFAGDEPARDRRLEDRREALLGHIADDAGHANSLPGRHPLMHDVEGIDGGRPGIPDHRRALPRPPTRAARPVTRASVHLGPFRGRARSMGRPPAPDRPKCEGHHNGDPQKRNGSLFSYHAFFHSTIIAGVPRINRCRNIITMVMMPIILARCANYTFHYKASMAPETPKLTAPWDCMERSKGHMSNILFTPGPLALSPFVKEAMLFDIGSRDAAFRRITQDIREQILAIVHGQDSHTVIPIQGSGTFAVEAALTTFVGSRDKVLVCVNGQYGDRILTILKRHDLAFEAVVCPVTRVPDLERVADRLRADPSFTHLCFVHCETTTGILNPMRALIDLARERGVVTIIDSMSAFGGIEIDARSC